MFEDTQEKKEFQEGQKDEHGLDRFDKIKVIFANETQNEISGVDQVQSEVREVPAWGKIGAFIFTQLPIFIIQIPKQNNLTDASCGIKTVVVVRRKFFIGKSKVCEKTYYEKQPE